MEARPLTWVLVALASLGALEARATEPFTAHTLQPLLHNEVNALQLHHLFLQSQFALDDTPLTIGSGVRAAPARYLRTDGVTEAGLGKVLYTLSWGTGRPTTGVALFGGLTVAQVRPSGFPNLLALSGDRTDRISAQGGSGIVFLGLSVHGWAAQLALYPTGLTYDADALGRFQPGGCWAGGDCSPSREVRPGSPVPGTPVHTSVQDVQQLIHLESKSGVSIASLLGTVHRVDDQGRIQDRRALAAVRALAEPYELVPREVGLFGTGLNHYAPEVDYYGDRTAETLDAAREGSPLPAVPEHGIWEVPLLAENIAETGVAARVVVQALPSPTFRLAEVGFAMERSPRSGLVVQGGTRLQLFRRSTSYTPAADAYAGVFWLFDEAKHEDRERGLSSYLSYSYNSPDSLTFVPLPNAHVLGLQLVFGNPMALPPPISIVKYPEVGA